MFDSIIEINTFLKHKNYYDTWVYSPISNQKEASVVYFKYISPNDIIDYSIVMPVFNMEHCIIPVLKHIFTNTTKKYEIILILDNCIDKTKSLCINLFDTFNLPKNLLKITIIDQPTPIFETASDNIGFRLSVGKYIVEIQSDMLMTVLGYNEIMTIPFKKYNDIIVVSARGCISITLSKDRKKTTSINNNYTLTHYDKTNIIVDECPIRGPWCIDNDKLKKIDYLDENNFHQAYDEADLALRAYTKYKYVCCHYALKINSPNQWGASRKYLIKYKDKDNVRELEKNNKISWKLKIDRSNGGIMKNYCDWKNTLWPKPFKNAISWRNKEIRKIVLTSEEETLIKKGYM